jgi:hypothetical protein
LTRQEGGFLLFLVFQLHQHGGHWIHGKLLSSLSPWVGV